MKIVKINAFALGTDLVIGANNTEEGIIFFVNTKNGIVQLSEDEMGEKYGIVPADTDLLCTPVSDTTEDMN